jgi:hypothetical protein
MALMRSLVPIGVISHRSPKIQLLTCCCATELFRMPFSVYTDPSLQVYDALGMTKYCMSFNNTLSGNGFGPRGEYIRHGTVFGLGIVMAKAVKVNMPVWRGTGSIEQLGGEFILGPGYVSIFVCHQPSEFQR